MRTSVLLSEGPHRPQQVLLASLFMCVSWGVRGAASVGTVVAPVWAAQDLRQNVLMLAILYTSGNICCGPAAIPALARIPARQHL